MALEKIVTQDKIEIVGNFNLIHVRTKTQVMEDGIELSHSFHRHVVSPSIPDSALANESAKVRALASVLFTDEVKAAFVAATPE